MTLEKIEGLYFAPWETLRVVGPDAASWLNGIATGDVLSVRPGRACWSSLLTKQGKVQADLQVVGTADQLFLAVTSGDAGAVRDTLDGYLVMEDAEIEPSDQRWLLGLGSEACERLEALSLVGGRVTWTNEDVGVFVTNPDGQTSIHVGAPRLTDEQFAHWCIQQGMPRFGVDYSSSDNLHAAALERRTVDWSKGCYLGQEVVCMQDMRGKVKQRLVHLLSPELTATAGDLVFSTDGVELGKVTSAIPGIAIASVRAAGYEPGTQLRIGSTSVSVATLR